MKSASAPVQTLYAERTEAAEESRSRLIRVALRLFANQGFANTSIRQITQAAKANIASISYYFGDKAGLYRAAFFEICGRPEAEIARFSDPGLTLTEALRGVFDGFLLPWQDGDMARDSVRLHFREMLEPTGLWADEISQNIKPQHDALVGVLCRHLGLKRPDDEIRRLALSIATLGLHLYICGDVTDALAPRLNAGPKALSTWNDRLVMYAEAMVRAEAARRTEGSAEAKKKSKVTKK